MACEILLSILRVPIPRVATSIRQACASVNPSRHFPNSIVSVISPLPVGIIAEAERRAREVGVGADRATLVLVGAITEHDYVAALARYLGVPFETLEATPRETCPHDDERLLAAPAGGMLPLRKRQPGLNIVVAPRKHSARRLCILSRSGDLLPRLSLTTSDELQHFVDRHCNAAIEHRASKHLKISQPAAFGGAFRLRLRMNLADLSPWRWLPGR